MAEKKVFLHIDLAGWSEWETKNPETSSIALAWYVNFIQKVISKSGAFIYEHSDNRYFIAYDSPDTAFNALLELGEGIFGEKWPGMGSLPVKIAAHYGDAESSGIHPGAAAARAAALLRYASAGNVYITKSFKEAVTKIPINIKIRQIGTVKLDDNFSEAIVFHILFFDYHADVSSMTRSARIESNFVPQKLNFTGRNHELSELLTLFKDHKYRVIGITGPVGIGKSRLALQVASELRVDCIDGSFFVNLSSVRYAEFVPFIIAETLKAEKLTGMSNQGPVDRLVTLIHFRKIILILDGIDHVKDISSLIRRLIKECPYLKIITTSEKIPNIGNIDIFEVEEMKFPLETDLFHVKLLSSYPAVEFIMQSAISSGIKIDPSDDRLGGIVEVSRKLNGNPYAMDLFISNYKNLEPQSFPSSISQAGGTLNSVIKYVFEKSLTQEEKTFLTIVSVFEPSFNTIDAEALCVAAGADLKNPSLFCEELFNKRILFRMTVPDGAVRYCLNLHFRVYVQTSHGEVLKQYTRLYEDYLLKLSDKYMTEQGTINAQKITGVITRRIRNFRLLLLRLIEENRDEQVEKLVLMFAMLDYYTDSNFELIFWLEKSVNVLNFEKHKRTLLYCEIRKGWRLTIIKNTLEFNEKILKTLESARENNYYDIQILALNQLGWRAAMDNDSEKAFKYFDEALSLVKDGKISDPFYIADVYIKQARGWGSRGNSEYFLQYMFLTLEFLAEKGLFYEIHYFQALGELESYYGSIKEYDNALKYLFELKRRYEELEDRLGVAEVISRFGLLESKRDNCKKALDYYKESLAVYMKECNISGISTMMIYLCECDYQLGNYSLALEEGIEGLKLSYESYIVSNISKVLFYLGLLYQKLGYFDRAVYMYGAYKSWIKKNITVKIIYHSFEKNIDAQIKELRSKLDQAEFAAAWMDGFNSDMESIVLKVINK